MKYLSVYADFNFLPRLKAESLIAQVRAGVAKWPSLAKQLHIPAAEVSLFSQRLNQFV